MNRTLETRLSKIERASGFDPDDRFSWFDRLSDDDLSRFLYHVHHALASHPESTSEQAVEARQAADRIGHELSGNVAFEPRVEQWIMSNLGIERWA